MVNTFDYMNDLINGRNLISDDDFDPFNHRDEMHQADEIDNRKRNIPS